MDELDIWDPFKKMRGQEKNLIKSFDSHSFDFDSMIKTPLLDVKDEGKNLKVVAELPGIKKENIDIDVTDNQLILKGRMSSDKEEKNKKKGYYFKERKASSYFKSVSLPSEIDADKAKAEFNNGVLKLTLPKKQGKKSKSFKVKVK